MRTAIRNVNVTNSWIGGKKFRVFGRSDEMDLCVRKAALRRIERDARHGDVGAQSDSREHKYVLHLAA